MKTDAATRERVCQIARAGPNSLGKPFATWSLPKLRDYLVATGVVGQISAETLRQILRRGGVSWQATKTWKTSIGPDFAAKRTGFCGCMIIRRLMSE